MVRSTGLTNEEEDTQFLLEAAQGDLISGKISRAEVAGLIVAALGSAAATGAQPLVPHVSAGLWGQWEFKVCGFEVYVLGL